MARRKKGKPMHGITTEVAEKANSAGDKAELSYSRKLRGKKTKMLIVRGRAGAPDITAYDRGWKFYEVKPHKKEGYLATPDDRRLRPDQKKTFKAMLEKGIGVTIAYYYRRILKDKRGRTRKDKHGLPLYSFTWKVVPLKKDDFKRGNTLDPEIFEAEDRLISV